MKKKTVKNRLDRLWSQITREKKYCEICGKAGNNPHHIIGRRNLNLRWDLRNACLLCSGCHTLNRNSAHQNPIWFMDWLKQNRPEDLKYLKEKQKESPRPYSIEDYLKTEEKLKHELENM